MALGLEYFTNTLHTTDSLHKERGMSHEFSSFEMLSSLRSMVSQDRHLFSSHCIVIERAVEGLSNCKGRQYSEDNRQKEVDTLSSFKHDHTQRVCQSAVSCQHSTCAHNDVGLPSYLPDLHATPEHKLHV